MRKSKLKTFIRKFCNAAILGAKEQKNVEKIQSLFDSSERSGSPRGLISLLAKAMTDKAEIAIIYETGVVRLADQQKKKRSKKITKIRRKAPSGFWLALKITI